MNQLGEVHLELQVNFLKSAEGFLLGVWFVNNQKLVKVSKKFQRKRVRRRVIGKAAVSFVQVPKLGVRILNIFRLDQECEVGVDVAISWKAQADL